MEIQPPTLEMKERVVLQMSRPQPPTLVSYLLFPMLTVRVSLPLVGRLMRLLMNVFSFCTSLCFHKRKLCTVPAVKINQDACSKVT
jgi:hypothetical protein